MASPVDEKRKRLATRPENFIAILNGHSKYTLLRLMTLVLLTQERC